METDVKVEPIEDSVLRTKVTRIIISDIKANGPIRNALLGIYKDEEQTPDAECPHCGRRFHADA